MVLGLLVCWLAALLPAVMLYFPNTAEITFGQMLPYFGILTGIAVLAWAGMFLVTRRKGLAALAAALWLLVLLNIGRFVPALQSVFPSAGFRIVAPVTLVLLIAATVALSRLKEEFLRDAARVAALALAAFVLSSAVPALFRGAQRGTVSAADAGFDITPAEGTDRPNIYWIVSDEYAGIRELEKYYHYDNSPFYDSLRALGMTVSEDSYNWSDDTFTIFEHILRLKHVQSSNEDKLALVADPGAPLWTLLRSLGYEVFEAESTDKFNLTDRLAAGTRDSLPKTEDGETVAGLLLRYSILYRYEDAVIDRFLPKQSEKTDRELILNVFEWAEDSSNLKSRVPSCTLLYVKSPHAPFLFDQDGGKVPKKHRRDHEDQQYYLGQLQYVSSRLLAMCETIVSTDPGAVIILQSDHGKRFVPNITYYDMTNVLNAVYFRGESIGEIQGLNGLNTWIAVLNRQFRLGLPLAEEVKLPNEYRPDCYNPDAENPNEGLVPAPVPEAGL